MNIIDLKRQQYEIDQEQFAKIGTSLNLDQNTRDQSQKGYYEFLLQNQDILSERDRLIYILCATYVCSQIQQYTTLDGNQVRGNGIVISQLIKCIDSEQQDATINDFLEKIRKFISKINLEQNHKHDIMQSVALFRLKMYFFQKFQASLNALKLQYIGQQYQQQSFLHQQSQQLNNNNEVNNNFFNYERYLQTLKNFIWILYLIGNQNLKMNDITNNSSVDVCSQQEKIFSSQASANSSSPSAQKITVEEQEIAQQQTEDVQKKLSSSIACLSVNMYFSIINLPQEISSIYLNDKLHEKHQSDTTNQDDQQIQHRIIKQEIYQLVSKNKVDQTIMQEVEDQIIQIMKNVRQNIHKKRSPETADIDIHNYNINNMKDHLAYQQLFSVEQIEINYQVYKQYYENNISDIQELDQICFLNSRAAPPTTPIKTLHYEDKILTQLQSTTNKKKPTPSQRLLNYDGNSNDDKQNGNQQSKLHEELRQHLNYPLFQTPIKNQPTTPGGKCSTQCKNTSSTSLYQNPPETPITSALLQYKWIGQYYKSQPTPIIDFYMRLISPGYKEFLMQEVNQIIRQSVDITSSTQIKPQQPQAGGYTTNVGGAAEVNGIQNTSNSIQNNNIVSDQNNIYQQQKQKRFLIKQEENQFSEDTNTQNKNKNNSMLLPLTYQSNVDTKNNFILQNEEKESEKNIQQDQDLYKSNFYQRNQNSIRVSRTQDFFFNALEKMINSEENKLSHYSNKHELILQLIQNDKFLNALLALCIQTINFIQSWREIDLNTIINLCKTTGLDMWKIISNFARFDPSMTQTIRENIFNIERKLLLFTIWEDNHGQEAIKLAQQVSNQLSDDDSQQKQKAVSNYQAIFCRRLEYHTALRVYEICIAVECSEEAKDKIWQMIKHIIQSHLHIMSDIHMDQIIICTLYAVCKHYKLHNYSFRQILTYCENIPFYNYQTLVKVKVKNEETQKLEIKDLIEFYNKYYLKSVNKLINQMASPSINIIASGSSFNSGEKSYQREQRQSMTPNNLSLRDTIPKNFLLFSPICQKKMYNPQQSPLLPSVTPPMMRRLYSFGESLDSPQKCYNQYAHELIQQQQTRQLKNYSPLNTNSQKKLDFDEKINQGNGKNLILQLLKNVSSESCQSPTSNSQKRLNLDIPTSENSSQNRQQSPNFPTLVINQHQQQLGQSVSDFPQTDQSPRTSINNQQQLEQSNKHQTYKKSLFSDKKKDEKD